MRERGTRTRAGNAMNRTRAALLDGARRAVEVNGTKITMAQVAAAAGVAKATLYNHFRTREAVLAALVLDEVARWPPAPPDCRSSDALAETAHGASPATRCCAPWPASSRRRSPRWAASTCAPRAGSAPAPRSPRRWPPRGAAAPTVLRWLASYLLSPASSATIAGDLAILLAGAARRAAGRRRGAYPRRTA